ncbi:MAG TPA: ATPase domain-containing protein [Bacilli bacterium]|nr:ATPase domain-containing protein [Bacilli bacterium]
MDPIRAPALQRLSTGDNALDAILGGGVPARSVTILAGEPGAGKTVLTLQMAFHAARQGKRCLYLSTLAEPPIKLLRYMQLFGFFDPELVDKQIFFADLATALRGGIEATLAELSERIEAIEPGMIVIDSFRAIGDLLRDPGVGRSFAYEVAVLTASWGGTTLLVGEYTREEIRTLPEFSIADGIVWLGAHRQELTAVRELEVLKLRGSAYMTGRHFFELCDTGLVCYPRVQAPKTAAESPSTERVSTGVAGLDALLTGGVPHTSATLVHGATGAGKTLLCLHYLLEGARRGEKGILFTLEETPDQIRSIARSFGWDLAAMEARGLLEIDHASPVELSTDRFLEQARQRLYAGDVRRAVLDGLTSLGLGVPSERRFKELVYAITKHARAAGVTLFMTMEAPELLGTLLLPGAGISFATDNIVQLRYVEVEGRLDRAISVLKARGIRHETGLRSLTMTDAGLEVTRERFRDLRGVLSGERTAPPEPKE